MRKTLFLVCTIGFFISSFTSKITVTSTSEIGPGLDICAARYDVCTWFAEQTHTNETSASLSSGDAQRQIAANDAYVQAISTCGSEFISCLDD